MYVILALAKKANFSIRNIPSGNAKRRTEQRRRRNKELARHLVESTTFPRNVSLARHWREPKETRITTKVPEVEASRRLIVRFLSAEREETALEERIAEWAAATRAFPPPSPGDVHVDVMLSPEHGEDNRGGVYNRVTLTSESFG